jgi:hypothetical protein
MPVRHCGQLSQAAGGSALAARHIGGGPHEHQVVGIARRLAADEGVARLGYIGAISRGGV